MEEKNENNEIYTNDNQNYLKEELENNKEINLLTNKEQLNQNDIIKIMEILSKIKSILEEKNNLKSKNKEKKRSSKKVYNLEDFNDKQKKENINIIISSFNILIDLFSKKYINEENQKEINLNNLSRLLKHIQTAFNFNSEILEKIEIICNLLVSSLKDKEQILIFLEIIIESLNYYENQNNNFLIEALKSISDILNKYSFLVEPLYDVTIPKIYNILDLNKNDNQLFKIFSLKILLAFIYNNVFSYDLVENGLLKKIREILFDSKKKFNGINNQKNINNENIKEEELKNNVNEEKESDNDIIKEIYVLLISLTNVDSNLIKISEELMDILLNEFIDENYLEDQNIDIKIDFFELLLEKEVKNIDIFIKYKGIQCIYKLLKLYDKNKNIILKIFHIISMILTYNNTYNELMIKLKFHEYIQNIIDIMGIKEREIDFKGKSVLFLINFGNKKLEEVEEYDFNNIRSSKKGGMVPSYIANFLTNGKVVKIVNSLGETKKKYLFFTNDFMKVNAKKVNSNLPPKQKYILETTQITSIVKGYGTEAFKKSKRFYRAVPDANKCFSIIAFNPTEGKKSINVICEKESETDKWINYIKVIITYLQENNRITKNITFS